MTRIELIAEVSSNHGGSFELAKEFIQRFAEAGADWIKLQHTRVAHLRHDDPQYAWFQRAELALRHSAELKATCEQAEVKFLTTAYHAADVPEVASLGLEAIKIGSGEAREAPLAQAIRTAGFQRIFIGLGLCHNQSDNTAWSHQQVASQMKVHPTIPPPWPPVTYMGCLTRYPAPRGWAPRIIAKHGYPSVDVTGWSDHSVGIEECCSAIVAGATVIEKHVQLPTQARPCQPWEASIEEFKALRKFADEDPERFLGRWQAT